MMAAKGKGIGIGALVLLGLIAWWLFRDEETYGSQLASDVASGKLPTIPVFGDDNTVLAAEATASAPLNLSTSTGPTNATGF